MCLCVGYVCLLACGSAYSDRAVVWCGEWVGPGIDVLDGSTYLKANVAVLGFSAFASPLV